MDLQGTKGTFFGLLMLLRTSLAPMEVLKGIWRRRRVADQWRFAEGLWISKEENNNQIWTISLICVEGKVFFLASPHKRLTEFLLKNNFIDPLSAEGRDLWSF